MKVNVELIMTVVIVFFVIYGAYLIEVDHEVIGGLLEAVAAFFILLLMGRVERYNAIERKKDEE